jgi:hypothetical protein
MRPVNVAHRNSLDVSDAIVPTLFLGLQGNFIHCMRTDQLRHGLFSQTYASPCVKRRLIKTARAWKGQVPLRT